MIVHHTVLALLFAILVFICLYEQYLREQRRLLEYDIGVERTEADAIPTPTMKPFPVVESVDCGYFPASATRMRNPQGGMGLSLLSLRSRKAFAPSFSRIYTCWRCTNVTEGPYHYGTEAQAIFQLSPSSLVNMTRSKLSLFVTSPEAVEVIGIVPAAEGLDQIPEQKIPRVIDNGEAQDGPVHFDTSDFLTAIKTHPNASETEKIATIFLARRKFNPGAGIGCMPVLNTTIHSPSLRVFYV